MKTERNIIADYYHLTDARGEEAGATEEFELHLLEDEPPTVTCRYGEGHILYYDEERDSWWKYVYITQPGMADKAIKVFFKDLVECYDCPRYNDTTLTHNN